MTVEGRNRKMFSRTRRTERVSRWGNLLTTAERKIIYLYIFISYFFFFIDETIDLYTWNVDFFGHSRETICQSLEIRVRTIGLLAGVGGTLLTRKPCSGIAIVFHYVNNIIIRGPNGCQCVHRYARVCRGLVAYTSTVRAIISPTKSWCVELSALAPRHDRAQWPQYYLQKANILQFQYLSTL